MKAAKMEASEDNLEELRNICDSLQKEVDRLHTREKEVEELRKECVRLVTKAGQLNDVHKEMKQLQAKEKEVEELQKERIRLVAKVNKLSDLQKEVERLQAKKKEVEEFKKERVELVAKVNKLSDMHEAKRLNVKEKGVALYSEVQKISDNEREAQDLRKCNEVRVELCRQIGLAEDYLSVSERSQITEATSERRDVYNPNYEENPDLILELQALRGFVFRLKEAQISNGMLRSLVKEFQKVVTEHENKIKQLLIQTYPILSATERLVSHSILCHIPFHCERFVK